MSTKLYVGNLPFDITEEDLRNVLTGASQGEVRRLARSCRPGHDNPMKLA